MRDERHWQRSRHTDVTEERTLLKALCTKDGFDIELVHYSVSGSVHACATSDKFDDFLDGYRNYMHEGGALDHQATTRTWITTRHKMPCAQSDGTPFPDEDHCPRRNRRDEGEDDHHIDLLHMACDENDEYRNYMQGSGILAVVRIVRWRAGCASIRVGEASHRRPGTQGAKATTRKRTQKANTKKGDEAANDGSMNGMMSGIFKQVIEKMKPVLIKLIRDLIQTSIDEMMGGGTASARRKVVVNNKRSTGSSSTLLAGRTFGANGSDGPDKIA